MRIAPGEKFACYAFTRCWLADGMPREIELRPRLWAATSLDFDVAEHWQSWLGSITMGELCEANLIIYTTMASSRPEILDDENATLAKILDYVLFGLVLQGIPAVLEPPRVRTDLRDRRVQAGRQRASPRRGAFRPAPARERGRR
jgi:hypothetical protein